MTRHGGKPSIKCNKRFDYWLYNIDRAWKKKEITTNCALFFSLFFLAPAKFLVVHVTCEVRCLVPTAWHFLVLLHFYWISMTCLNALYNTNSFISFGVWAPKLSYTFIVRMIFFSFFQFCFCQFILDTKCYFIDLCSNNVNDTFDFMKLHAVDRWPLSNCGHLIWCYLHEKFIFFFQCK